MMPTERRERPAPNSWHSFWMLRSAGGIWGQNGGHGGFGVVLGSLWGPYGIIFGVIFGVLTGSFLGSQSNGWDPAEMFRFNEENYGVKTTYDSSLAAYT